MTWQETYNKKRMSAEEAVKHIPSGSNVVVGHAAATPKVLVDALVSEKDHFKDLSIIHLLTLGAAPYAEPGLEEHFRAKVFFVGPNTRQAVEEGRADYIPSFFYQVPSLFKDETVKVDVALIQVTPPDEKGYCNLGLACDYTKPAADLADVVIAEVNDQMPRIYGDNLIHVDDITCIVEASHPMPEIPEPRISDVEKAIGEHCASLIQDGDTLQLGIGSIPDAVLKSLHGKKDLGIHTEMFSDGIISLVEEGIVNGSKKSLKPGIMVATFLMGTKKFYDFIHENPMVEMHPVDYVNNPLVIMQNDNLVSINSCIEVDLMGQVASESIGLKQFSGTGGQVDYVRGASMGENGRSIIAIPSTASKGTLSRIVPLIKEGSAITTSRNDVHYVVTEYGIADLRGKSLRERAKALIAIAHPDFQDELKKEFEQRFKETY